MPTKLNVSLRTWQPSSRIHWTKQLGLGEVLQLCLRGRPPPPVPQLDKRREVSARPRERSLVLSGWYI